MKKSFLKKFSNFGTEPAIFEWRGKTIILTPVLDHYLFYLIWKDERQNQPQWNMNSECTDEWNATKCFAWHANGSVSSLP